VAETGDPVLTVVYVGGPTAVLEYGGLRFLTDPTFDPPGTYERAPRPTLTKTAGPAVGPEEVGAIDAVLLSHDHHDDNLDGAGRDFLPRAARVLTTVAGAERLGGNAIGLEPWSSIELERPDGPPLAVTAVGPSTGPTAPTT
jgi:L-ascorbate metabolism protein UlaG (beta-lactamase superfamily)